MDGSNMSYAEFSEKAKTADIKEREAALRAAGAGDMLDMTSGIGDVEFARGSTAAITILRMFEPLFCMPEHGRAFFNEMIGTIEASAASVKAKGEKTLADLLASKRASENVGAPGGNEAKTNNYEAGQPGSMFR